MSMLWLWSSVRVAKSWAVLSSGAAVRQKPLSGFGRSVALGVSSSSSSPSLLFHSSARGAAAGTDTRSVVRDFSRYEKLQLARRRQSMRDVDGNANDNADTNINGNGSGSQRGGSQLRNKKFTSKDNEEITTLNFKSSKEEKDFFRGVPVFDDKDEYGQDREDNDIGDDSDFEDYRSQNHNRHQSRRGRDEDSLRLNRKNLRLAKLQHEKRRLEDNTASGSTNSSDFKRDHASLLKEQRGKRFVRESLPVHRETHWDSDRHDDDDDDSDYEDGEGDREGKDKGKGRTDRRGGERESSEREYRSKREPVNGQVEKRIRERLNRQRDREFEDVHSLLSPSTKSAHHVDERRGERGERRGGERGGASTGAMGDSNRPNRRERRMSQRMHHNDNHYEPNIRSPTRVTDRDDEISRRFYAKKLHKDWRVKHEVTGGPSHTPAVTTIRDFDGDHLFGLDPIKLALLADRRVCVELLAQEDMDLENKRNSHDAQEILALAKEKRLRITHVSKHDLNMISENRPHQGFILRARPLRMESIDSLEKTDDYQVVLALDELWDPQNFGALLRTSHFLGVNRVVVCAKNSAPLNAVVSKTSAGAMEVQPVYSTDNMMRFLDNAKNNGWRVLGTAVDPSAVEVSSIDRSQPTILVLGNEGHGIRTNVIHRCDSLVKVSAAQNTDTHIDSLNVSVCGGILMHHLLRK